MVSACIAGCDTGSMETSGMATEIVEELRMDSKGVDENHNTIMRLENNDFSMIIIFVGDGCKVYNVDSTMCKR
jgi:hypothetical protein